MATATKRATAAQRFWAKVEPRDRDACWLWRGAVSKSRRGAFWLDGRQVPAHRFAYELAEGALPAGMKVVQMCGETLCVRRDHLVARPVEDVDCVLRRGEEEAKA